MGETGEEINKSKLPVIEDMVPEFFIGKITKVVSLSNKKQLFVVGQRNNKVNSDDDPSNKELERKITSSFDRPFQKGDYIECFILNGKITAPPYCRPDISTDLLSEAVYGSFCVSGHKALSILKEITTSISSEVGGFYNIMTLLDQDTIFYFQEFSKDFRFKEMKTMLGSKGYKLLLTWWFNNVTLRRCELLGIDKDEVEKMRILYNALDIASIAKKHPYSLPGISMEKAEEISYAFRIENKIEKSDLITGLILRYVWKCLLNNNTKIKTLSIVRKFEGCSKYLDKMTDQGLEFIGEYSCFRRIRLIELDVSEMIHKMIKTKANVINFHKPNKMPLEDEQIKACKTCLSSQISIAGGGPGTGKTTGVIIPIVESLEKETISYIVIGFTGTCIAGVKDKKKDVIASTIHSYLISGEQPPDVIIIEEASMCTTELFWRIKLMSPKSRIILAGDPYQLPPISWGCIFHILCDLSFSGKLLLPYVELVINHRNSNALARNAAQIRKLMKGEIKESDFELEFDKSFVHLESKEEILESVERVATRGIGFKDIKIITPYREDCIWFNYRIQSSKIDIELFEKDSDPIESVVLNYKKWNNGDQVIATSNNYDIKILNGEQGIITKVENSQMTVKFNNGKSINYFDRYVEGCGKAISLDLAYAITGHRGQGMEREYIYVYIPEKAKTQSNFVNIRLIYSMFTRGKHRVCIAGNLKSIYVLIKKMIKHQNQWLEVFLIFD